MYRCGDCGAEFETMGVRECVRCRGTDLEPLDPDAPRSRAAGSRPARVASWLAGLEEDDGESDGAFGCPEVPAQGGEAASVEDEVLRVEMAERVRNILATLTVVEEKVLRCRFGFGGAPLTLEQTAQKLGYSVSQVFRVEALALMKLRHPTRSRKLKVFLE